MEKKKIHKWPIADEVSIPLFRDKCPPECPKLKSLTTADKEEEQLELSYTLGKM